MKRLFKWIFAAVLLSHSYPLMAQETVIANTAMNVVYQGLLNPINIVSQGIPRNKLKISCDEVEIIDSQGKFYLFIPDNTKKREICIKIGDKRKSGKDWSDSCVFRVKRVPKPDAQLGTLQPGVYQRGEIAIQNTLYAYLDGFVFDGVKFVVTGYTIKYLNIMNLEIAQKTIQGNRTWEIKKCMQNNRGITYLDICDIKAILTHTYRKGKPDTLKLAPISYTTNADKNNDLIAEFYKGSKLITLKEGDPVDTNFVSAERRILKKKDGRLLAERKDSAGKMTWFRRYYDTSKTILKLELLRLSDSSIYIRHYNSQGICLSEGQVLFPIYDIYEPGWMEGYENYNYLNHPDSIRKSIWYFRIFPYYRNMMPLGEWKFYDNNGALYAQGSYLQGGIKKEEPEQKEPEYFTFTCGPDLSDYGQPIGTWKFYNSFGKLIHEENFNILKK